MLDHELHFRYLRISKDRCSDSLLLLIYLLSPMQYLSSWTGPITNTSDGLSIPVQDNKAGQQSSIEVPILNNVHVDDQNGNSDELNPEENASGVGSRFSDFINKNAFDSYHTVNVKNGRTITNFVHSLRSICDNIEAMRIQECLI
ncbi:unnamed protein product [Lepeophtheirus salmonis]|uniref:(salmon louse) hypothetical protein n=1 Tax=Lepeophtheirus salmonis TaxID=72036 RepID=A0A7R8CKB6_LEPSM|nr:unnamed protein product [Lepeophtheirus salmonis]CAF2801708.1 unnamed protein product [Lepeophtheirus salmonis]